MHKGIGRCQDGYLGVFVQVTERRGFNDQVAAAHRQASVSSFLHNIPDGSAPFGWMGDVIKQAAQPKQVQPLALFPDV
jgi:hypothetical protein